MRPVASQIVGSAQRSVLLHRKLMALAQTVPCSGKAMALGALLAMILTACAEPSPWSNIITLGDHKNLTRKALSRLEGKDEPFAPFTVGLIADPQVLPGYLRLVSSALDDRDDIAFSLIAGDLTDRSLRTEFLWVANVVAQAKRPIFTVVGNHDGLIYGEAIYKDVFGDLNYSFIYRDIKFIMWNNNPYEWGYPDFSWMRQEIASHPHVVIVSHQPPGDLERYLEANDEFRELYSHPNLLGSVHGHMHNPGFQRIEGKPALTAPRVDDTNYAIMRIEADMKIEFDLCKESACQKYEK